MHLSELASLIPGAVQGGAAGDPELNGCAHDSRAVGPGDLFCCVRGERADGHRFLPDAVARGAVAAVCEHAVQAHLPQLLVPDVRAVMPEIAAAVYNHPSRELRMVGVTGTNGKTTTTYLIAALARAAENLTGVIGTIGVRIDLDGASDLELPADRTTPEAPEIQGLLRRMVTPGTARVVSMEVSSHALDLGRTRGCEFDVAVFTNLTQDHLDFHGTMEAYYRAKARLFTQYPESSSKPFAAVVNLDDPYGRRLATESRGRVITYGVEHAADLRATDVTATPSGIAYTLACTGELGGATHHVSLRLGGLFNVYNSLAALAAGRALGFGWEALLSGIAAAPGVPGRFESVDRGQEFGVLVDYAHTPDGLSNVLTAARALGPRRLIAVFGCGGDRDRTKRPIMGRIAAELADVVIATSDNPRSEDPPAILAEIAAGIPPARMGRVRTVVDRREAIQAAIQEAGPGDLVVIAGKGHETYQIFASETVHFDDREEAARALDARHLR